MKRKLPMSDFLWKYLTINYLMKMINKPIVDDFGNLIYSWESAVNFKGREYSISYQYNDIIP